MGDKDKKPDNDQGNTKPIDGGSTYITLNDPFGKKKNKSD